MAKLLPTSIDLHRAPAPLSAGELDRIKQEATAVAGSNPFHTNPWRDPYDTRVELEELVHHLRRELADAEAALAGATAADLDRYSPDDRAADRDADRAREQRQDQHAGEVQL